MVTYRRGLTRAYLVLWAIWILFLLVIFPWYLVREASHEYVNWYIQSLSDPSLKEIANSYKEAASYRAVYRDIFKDWQLLLVALLGVPALLYGVMYGTAVTFRGTLRWIVRGFKEDTPTPITPTESSDRGSSDWLRKCAGIGVLIVAVSVAYYFVVYLPRGRTARFEAEREKVESQRQERIAVERKEEKRQALLEHCLSTAFVSYKTRWAMCYA
jgi:hypothetical protein